MKMTSDEVREILERHSKETRDNPEGERVDLSGVDLSGANKLTNNRK